MVQRATSYHTTVHYTTKMLNIFFCMKCLLETLFIYYLCSLWISSYLMYKTWPYEQPLTDLKTFHFVSFYMVAMRQGFTSVMVRVLFHALECV